MSSFLVEVTVEKSRSIVCDMLLNNSARIWSYLGHVRMKWYTVSRGNPQAQAGSSVFWIWKLWTFRSVIPSLSLVCRVFPCLFPSPKKSGGLGVLMSLLRAVLKDLGVVWVLIFSGRSFHCFVTLGIKDRWYKVVLLGGSVLASALRKILPASFCLVSVIIVSM